MVAGPVVGSSAATLVFLRLLQGQILRMGGGGVLKVITFVLTGLQMKMSQCREAVEPVCVLQLGNGRTEARLSRATLHCCSAGVTGCCGGKGRELADLHSASVRVTAFIFVTFIGSL